MRIIFMGTSNFAVPVLESLYHNGYKVVLVVSQPDRPTGRGCNFLFSPVKKKAIQLKLDIAQPFYVNSLEFIRKIKSIYFDLYVVVSFGQILSEDLMKIPKYGAINIHPSILPKYRGPAPINWAIINGENKTGVSIILMDNGIDTGKIILREFVRIKKSDTFFSIHNKLSEMSSGLVLIAIDRICKKKIKFKIQNFRNFLVAPLFKKKDGLLIWGNSSFEIDCFIRGVTPWPGAFTYYNNKLFKIIEIETIDINLNSFSGTILSGMFKRFYVVTGHKTVLIKIIQVASGKKMSAQAFLSGFKIPINSIFTSSL